MRAARLLLAALLGTSAPVLLAPPTAVAAVPAGFSDTQVAAVVAPTGLAPTPDGRILVASQRGQIRVMKNGALLPTPALDLSSRICSNSERGVLGIAADPDVATRAVYVFYTPKGSDPTCPIATGAVNPPGAPRNRVSRFTLNGDVIDPASEVQLLNGIYSTAGFHNAGDLQVGRDGYLYVATGDGGCDYAGGGCGGDNDASRDRNILNGKILRITTTGAVPPDNPFLGAGTARCHTGPAPVGVTCQEAYAVGLRNPFRFAFDPNASGTSFRINDVGQNIWEEINQGQKGADYGWNSREGHCQRTNSETNCGTATPTGLTDPVYDYSHSTTAGGATCGSITGGAYVPDGVWPAAYAGSYLFSDYVCGTIFALTPGKVRTPLLTGLGASSAVAMAFAPDGATKSLYYTSYAGGGEVRKLAYTAAGNRAPVARLTASPTAGSVPLAVRLDGSSSTDVDGDGLSYTWSFGDGTANQTTSTSTVNHTYTSGGRFTATLTVRDPGGLTSASSVLVTPGSTAPTVTIMSPAAGQRFVVGGSYTLTGTATDAQDGTLPASSLRWTVIRHHGSHTHPLLGPLTGNNLAFTGPAPEDLDAAANSYLEIQLSATDSAGTTTTVSQDFKPVTVPVTFATSPAGRSVVVNGQWLNNAPVTVTSWPGYDLQVAVPIQWVAGQSYGFGFWSDGGAARHTYRTPASPSTLTATVLPAPTTPTSVVGRQSGASSATITWAPPSSAGGSAITGYRVTRDGVDSAGEGAYSTVVAASSRSFTLTRLVPGRIYTLTVAAVNGQGAGPAASIPVTVLGGGLATTPTPVTVRPTTAGTASISWGPPVSTGGQPVTGYRVSRDGTDAKGVGPYSTVVAATSTSISLTGLVPNRLYHLSVQAVTGTGTGAPATAAVVPDSAATISAPSSLAVRQTASGRVAISWDAPVVSGGKTITGYRVSRDGTDSTGAGAFSTVVPAATRTFTMTGLSAGQAYTLAVQAVVSTGETAPQSRGIVWTTS